MEDPLTPIMNQAAEAAPNAGKRTLGATGDGGGVPPIGKTGGKFRDTPHSYTDPDTGEVFISCPTPGYEGLYNLRPVCPNGLHPYAAITDFLNCTFKFDPVEEPLSELFEELYAVLGSQFAPAISRKKGFIRWKNSYQLGDSKAIFAIGGQNGRVMVSLSGESCALIQDWQKIISYFRDYRDAKITRWDGAVDDYSGIHSVDWAVEQYEAGNFNAGGNKPSSRNFGCWTSPDGSGRSFEVGKRENGKRIQIYEKGQQLGALHHPWVRWEVELHNTRRVIPWEVLLTPAHYVVGSYPKALHWVQEEMIRIRTIHKQVAIGYESLTSHARNAYGSLINVMLEVEGSPEAVINKLRRDGIPKRLDHPLLNKPMQERT